MTDQITLETTMFGTTSLGCLRSILKRMELDDQVVFDFCCTSPHSIHSYRGWYDHLALGWSYDKIMRIGDFSEMLSGAVGKTFGGWKGGDYRMDDETPIWVDNAGDASGTAIVGAEIWGGRLIIRTEFVDL